MSYRRREVSQYRGRYYRNLGKVLNAKGVLQTKKFLLGTDRTTAELANKLLEKLWAEVVAEHEHTVEWVERLGGRLADTDLITGHMDGWRRDKLHHGPHWRAESLRVAEAIRRGQRQITVQPFAGESGIAHVERIAGLARTYSVVAFVPGDSEFYAAARQDAVEQAGAHVDDAKQAAAEMKDTLRQPVPVEGPTLYEALDAYGEWARQQSAKEHAQREADRARRMKEATPDMPLEQFGYSSLEALANHWRSRPMKKLAGGKVTDKPISLETVRHMLRTGTRFVRWLDRSDQWPWEAPRYWQDALRADVQRLRTPEEIAKLKDGVSVWTVEELVELYRHASDQDRLFILLGLNLGAAQAEIFTLRRDELNRQTRPPTIRRIRQKTIVLGQWPLWPQTQAAIDWHLKQQRRVRPATGHEPYLLLTGRGRQFDRQRISNAWSALLRRVRDATPSFRTLSFKYLRKTAYQLVRHHSDGEVAGVFISHGQPVASDELSDVYGNRPFDKVAAALDAVHEDLRPVFAAAPGAFSRPQTRRRRSAAIGAKSK